MSLIFIKIISDSIHTEQIKAWKDAKRIYATDSFEQYTHIDAYKYCLLDVQCFWAIILHLENFSDYTQSTKQETFIKNLTGHNVKI